MAKRGDYCDPHLVIMGGDDDGHWIHDPISATKSVSLDGERTLKIVVTRDSQAGTVARVGQIIQQGEGYPEQYRVRSISTYRKGRVPVVEIHADALYYDLGFGTVESQHHEAITEEQAMRRCLAGTGWAIGSVTSTAPFEWKQNERSPLECLRDLASLVGAEVRFDDYRKLVHFEKPKTVDDAFAEFAWGKNVVDSRRTIDESSLLTRIYAATKDGRTFAEINGGKDYVEDLSYSKDTWRSAKQRFPDDTSPEEMLKECQELLNQVAKPQVSYELTLADWSQYDGYEADEFEVGDMVHVVDPDFEVRATERIHKIDYDLVRPWRTTVVVSGERPTLAKAFTQFENRIEKLERDRDADAGRVYMAVQRHGANGNTARPRYGGATYWIGIATPQDAREGDIWRAP